MSEQPRDSIIRAAMQTKRGATPEVIAAELGLPLPNVYRGLPYRRPRFRIMRYLPMGYHYRQSVTRIASISLLCERAVLEGIRTEDEVIAMLRQYR